VNSATDFMTKAHSLHSEITDGCG